MHTLLQALRAALSFLLSVPPTAEPPPPLVAPAVLSLEPDAPDRARLTWEAVPGAAYRLCVTHDAARLQPVACFAAGSEPQTAVGIPQIDGESYFLAVQSCRSLWRECSDPAPAGEIARRASGGFDFYATALPLPGRRVQLGGYSLQPGAAITYHQARPGLASQRIGGCPADGDGACPAAVLTPPGSLAGVSQEIGGAGSAAVTFELWQHPHAALLFDDGNGVFTGGRLTAQVILDEFGVKGNFFMIGSAIRDYPAAVRALVAAGHRVGNHTFSHPFLTRLTDAQIAQELDATEQQYRALVPGGSTRPCFRAPNGDINRRVIAVLQARGYRQIDWNVGSLDYSRISADQIVRNVLRDLHHGALISFHTNQPATMTALHTLIPLMQSWGYVFDIVCRTACPLCSLWRHSGYDGGMDEALLREIVIPGTSKIVLLVLDGLGGLPNPATGRTELEQADIPHLDALARGGICGLTVPVAPGVTPGSGPGHLALFGYDPIEYNIGRGVLEAVGIDFELEPSDVAARGNFCTVDEAGIITDRRAGRVPTATSVELCKQLATIELPGVQVFVEPVREHRFVLVLRGEGLSDRLSGTDPNREGLPPLPVLPLATEAQETADLLNGWLEQAKQVLAGRETANMVLVRGFAKYPTMPSMRDLYKLKAAAIAIYPMYRGLAKLVGMTALPGGASFEDEIETLRQHWDEFDFFFVHYKPTDAAGEDGDFTRKVQALEALDKLLLRLTALHPDVLMVAGDHSTPAIMAAHSWHSVPFMISSKWCRPDRAEQFNERACEIGSLGTFPAKDALSLAMAHAGRFTKYGA